MIVEGTIREIREHLIPVKDNDNVGDYVTWIKGLKFINITNSELDNTTFAAAEKKYLNTTNQEKNNG